MLPTESGYAGGRLQNRGRQDAPLMGVRQVGGVPVAKQIPADRPVPEIAPSLLSPLGLAGGDSSSLELVKTAAEQLSSPCYVYDLRGRRFVWANRLFERAFVPDADCSALDRLGYFEGGAPSSEHRERLNGTRDGEIVSTERRLRGNDGAWHWYHFRETVIARDHNRAPALILGLAEDITDCKLAELEAQKTAEQRETERRQRRLFETALELVPQGVAILDGERLSVQWNNQAFHQYLDEGLFNADVTGRQMEAIMPHVAGTGLDQVMRKVLASGRPASDLRYVVDGPRHSARYWRISLQPLPGPEGEPGNLMVQIDDVTEQLRPNKWMAANAGPVRVRH